MPQRRGARCCQALRPARAAAHRTPPRPGRAGRSHPHVSAQSARDVAAERQSDAAPVRRGQQRIVAHLDTRTVGSTLCHKIGRAQLLRARGERVDPLGEPAPRVGDHQHALVAVVHDLDLHPRVAAVGRSLTHPVVDQIAKHRGHRLGVAKPPAERGFGADGQQHAGLRRLGPLRPYERL